MKYVLGLLIGLASITGCESHLRPPDLGGLYSRTAREHQERNPVIVIPGILGSKLVDSESGRVVWGAFSRGYANPQTPDGARLVALPMREGATLAELTDGVRPAGVLDRVRLDLLGMPVELQAYVNIMATLGVGGYRDELLGQSGAVDYGKLHFTCFQFDYDWRRDNVENARRLHDFILEKRAYCSTAFGKAFGRTKADVKFDIVAHSMGGLVTRYFLEYGDADVPADGTTPTPTWKGAEYIERVVLIGTPNAGSVQAVNELVNGSDIGPLIAPYPAMVLGTMPSVYQLMPRGRHGAVLSGPAKHPVSDPCDVALWERFGWGLASTKNDKGLAVLLPEVSDPALRCRIARDHLRKCLDRAKAFHAALDVPSPTPAGLKMYLFAGDAVDTVAVGRVNPLNGKFEIIERAPGDGTVLRSSALMDERVGGAWSPTLVSPIQWTGVNFLFANHLELTKSPAFSDNVLYLLLEQPR